MLFASACSRSPTTTSASSPGPSWGSLPGDGGDRYSHLDLSFGNADDVEVADVLDDWTDTLVAELSAVQLIREGWRCVCRMPRRFGASLGASLREGP